MISFVDRINKNNFFIGVMMLTFTIMSKHIFSDLSPLQQKLIQHGSVRKIFIFSMFFIATKDIIISFVLTLFTILVLFGLLNETSKLCILPMKIKNLYKYDLNKDNELSPNEIEKAYFKLKAEGVL